jgi:plastocyanin
MVLSAAGVLGVGLIDLPASGAATVGVAIEDSQFVPPTVTVTVGDTVTWTDNGISPHSVTADDGTFDSSPGCPGTCLANGETFSHAFATPGTFAYHCRIHGASGGIGMSGVVIVQAPATTTTTAAPTTTAGVPTTPPTTIATTPRAVAGPIVAVPTFTG